MFKTKAAAAKYVGGLSRPRNLVIRMSAQQMDAEPPKGFEHTSTVHKNGAAPVSYTHLTLPTKRIV